MLLDSWLCWPEDIHDVFMVLRVSRTCSACAGFTEGVGIRAALPSA